MVATLRTPVVPFVGITANHPCSGQNLEPDKPVGWRCCLQSLSPPSQTIRHFPPACAVTPQCQGWHCLLCQSGAVGSPPGYPRHCVEGSATNVNGGSSQSRILQGDTCHTKFPAAASQASFDHADPTAISGRPRPPSCYALWLQGSYALPTLHLTTGSLSLRFLRHFKLNWRWMNAS